MLDKSFSKSSQMHDESVLAPLEPFPSSLAHPLKLNAVQHLYGSDAGVDLLLETQTCLMFKFPLSRMSHGPWPALFSCLKAKTDVVAVAAV